MTDRGGPVDPDAARRAYRDAHAESSLRGESDASQADVENDRRLHDYPSPIERGAIDRHDSVGRPRKGKGRPPR